jgi:DNA recombination protein RmuC
MGFPTLLLGVLTGMVLGGVTVWLLLKGKAARAAAETRAELQPQAATLTERVAARDQHISELQAALAAEENQKTQIAFQLQQESNALASAEQKNSRIPELEEQVKAREKQLQAAQEQAQADLQGLRQQMAGIAEERASAVAGLEAERKARSELEQNHKAVVAERASLQTELRGRERQNGDLATQVRFLEERLATERQQVESLQQRFQKEFEAVAHKLLVDNSSRFDKQSSETLDKLLSPLRENLQDFRARLDTVHQEAATHTALLKDQVARIGAEAANLSKALKGDVKVLGNWGENMLDQILAKSGLQSGVHYRRQHSAKDEAGDQRFLDVLVDLPDDKHLIIDSKVSLRAYEDYVNCTEEAPRLKHLESHIGSIRAHFRGLSAKSYQDTYGINTPDFVLMYIPIEAAFFVAVGEQPNLFSEALERNVVLITNSTLLATLRTVAGVWQLAAQHKNALEIADRGGKLYDKFVGFMEDLQKVGTKLKESQEAWEDANKKLCQGAGNLVGQAEKLKALGVKATKKLPSQVADKAEAMSPPPAQLAENTAQPAAAPIVTELQVGK